MTVYDEPLAALQKLNADIAQRKTDQEFLQALKPVEPAAGTPGDPGEALRAFLKLQRDAIAKKMGIK